MPVDDDSELVSAPGVLRPRKIRVVMLVLFLALLVAGFLRFDAGEGALSRIAAIAILVTGITVLLRWVRRATMHYEANPADLDRDRMRVLAQSKASASAQTDTVPPLLLGVVKIALLISVVVYTLLILLPNIVSPDDFTVVPASLLNYVLSFLVSLLPAAILVYRARSRSNPEDQANHFFR